MSWLFARCAMCPVTEIVVNDLGQVVEVCDKLLVF